MSTSKIMQGDYYAIKNGEYVKCANVLVQTPQSLKILQPVSRCHYMMEMTKHQDEKEQLKSVHLEDPISREKSVNNLEIPEKQSKTIPICVPSLPLLQKKGILKRSMNDLQSLNKNQTGKNWYNELQKQKQFKQQIESQYERILKNTISNRLKSQEVEDYIDENQIQQYLNSSRTNRYSQRYISSPTRKYKQNTVTKENYYQDQLNTARVKTSTFNDQVSPMKRVNIKKKNKMHHFDLQSYEGQYSKTLSKYPETKCPSEELPYHQKLITQLESMKLQVKYLQQQIHQQNQQYQKDQIKQQLKQKQMKIQFIEAENTRLKQHLHMLLNHKKQQEPTHLKLTNGIMLILLSVILIILLTSKSIIC